MSILKWIIGIPLVILLIVFAHYNLPSRDVVKIVGTDVKRMDISSTAWFWASPDAGTNAGSTRDVRFINAVRPNGKVRVYRNEDTNWNWPPYFKFNSGDMTAQAQALAQEPDTWVAVTHYGWRIKLFTIFPNAVKIKKVDGPDVFLIPWFNIIFLSLIALLLYIIYRLMRRFKRETVDPMVDDMVGDVERGTEEVRERAEAARSGARGWFKRWFG